jgi:hypothetical protein
MRPPRTMIVVLAMTAFAPGAAHAGCTASPAVDTCLVGTWKQTGGGAAEWMRQNLKMAQVGAVASNGTLTFNADGTFSTSKVDTKAEVGAKDAPMHATGQMSGQAGGEWSAAGGMLTLCMTAVSSKGTIELKGPSGEGMKMAMPQMKPAAASMSYTCDGDTLSTVQPMPKNTTMTTTYTKVH